MRGNGFSGPLARCDAGMTGCELLDRSITQEYDAGGLTTLTNDRKMAKLEGAEKH